MLGPDLPTICPKSCPKLLNVEMSIPMVPGWSTISYRSFELWIRGCVEVWICDSLFCRIKPATCNKFREVYMKCGKIKQVNGQFNYIA